MFNIEYKVTGSKLVIEVDMSKQAIDRAPPSTTGKTRLVASTRGYQPLQTTSGQKLAMALTVTVKD